MAYAKSCVYAGSRLLMTATKASSSTETQEFHHPDRLGTKGVTNGGTAKTFTFDVSSPTARIVHFEDEPMLTRPSAPGTTTRRG